MEPEGEVANVCPLLETVAARLEVDPGGAKGVGGADPVLVAVDPGDRDAEPPAGADGVGLQQIVESGEEAFGGEAAGIGGESVEEGDAGLGGAFVVGEEAGEEFGEDGAGAFDEAAAHAQKHSRGPSEGGGGGGELSGAGEEDEAANGVVAGGGFHRQQGAHGPSDDDRGAVDAAHDGLLEVPRRACLPEVDEAMTRLSEAAGERLPDGGCGAPAVDPEDVGRGGGHGAFSGSDGVSCAASLR